MEIFERIQNEYFEKKPFISSLKNDEIIEFNSTDFQEILIRLIDKSPESIQVTKQGKLVFPNLLTKRITYTEIINNYREGATITINFISSFNNSLGLLCEKLEKIFECPIECSAFLTPPNVQGFSPHFDSAEVFLIQVEGSKNWKIYPPIINFPLENQKAVVSDNIFKSVPILETNLIKNSILYIPRGFIHYGFSDGREASLHITFGLVLNRKYELATLFLEELATLFPSFRESIKYSEITRENIYDIIFNAFHCFENVDLIDEAIDKVKDKIAENRINQTFIQPDNDLLWHPSIETKLDAGFRKRKNLKFNLKKGYLIYSSLNGTKSISIPDSAFNIVVSIMNSKTFSIKTLTTNNDFEIEIVQKIISKFLIENIIVKI